MNLGVTEMQPTASTPSKRSASPYCLCSGARRRTLALYMKRPAWSVSQRMTRGQHSRDKLRCNAQAKGPNTIKPATIMLLPSSFRRCRVIPRCGGAAAVTPPVSPASVREPFSPLWPPLPCSQKGLASALLEQLEIRAMLRVVAGKSDTLGERAK